MAAPVKRSSQFHVLRILFGLRATAVLTLIAAFSILIYVFAKFNQFHALGFPVVVVLLLWDISRMIRTNYLLSHKLSKGKVICYVFVETIMFSLAIIGSLGALYLFGSPQSCETATGSCYTYERSPEDEWQWSFVRVMAVTAGIHFLIWIMSVVHCVLVVKARSSEASAVQVV